jgi:hypothetical protein
MKIFCGSREHATGNLGILWSDILPLIFRRKKGYVAPAEPMATTPLSKQDISYLLDYCDGSKVKSSFMDNNNIGHNVSSTCRYATKAGKELRTIGTR